MASRGASGSASSTAFDVQLAIAKRIEEFGVGTGHADVQITSHLKAARKCKEKLEKELHNAQASMPSLTPIHAVFTPSAVPGCTPPACTTVYTENATGQGLSYQWALSIPVDPACASGFQPRTPQPNQATWYHADTSEGGTCNHTGMTYDAAGRGHPGTVVVQVSNANWVCTATYFGTQGNSGAAVGDGDPPQACQPKPGP